MSAQGTTKAAEDKEIQIPEWEHAAVNSNKDGIRAATRPKQSTRAGLSGRLDSVLPPHKRYLGLSRKIFLIVMLAVLLALLALIVGLAVGLTKHSKYGLSSFN